VLQRLLLDAVVERLGEEAVRTGATVTGFGPAPAGVTVAFTDGAGAPRTLPADLLVAADGIHSAIRAQLYPHEGAPVWNRRVLWRGVSEAAPYLGGATMVMAGHESEKFVCYPIDPEAAARGRSLINWIAELRFPDEARWRREDWNREGRLADFLPRFEDWRFDWLAPPAIIRASRRIYEYPLVDRDPLDRWTFGRVTLLGDAAHPMYPIGSNGASQAILDARTLAYELAVGPDIDAALARYEAARRPATSRLVLANRRNGPEQVMQLAHERAPGGFSNVHDVLSAEELANTAGDYKRIAGFDREALAARPSLTPPAARG
jgi:2-polyprenyl-6-methoxyphenol hydroxylase-like FAD-dependent oxidoreductase